MTAGETPHAPHATLPSSPLQGLMQDWHMTTNRFLEHAANLHGARPVVSRLEDGSLQQQCYRDVKTTAGQLSNALITNGIVMGDRVATLAMNGAMHLAAWYGISGIGAVCHTLNPRFSDAQLIYIINHAADRIILADGAFAPLLQRLLPQCPSVERVVFFEAAAAGFTAQVAVTSFADFIAEHGPECRWGEFDERTAAGLCYTSGTTGEPKGVLYSHRSNVLHTLMTIQPDALGLSARDVVMPVVPMYHANAWGLTFSAPAVGAKLVLPGHRLDGESLCALMADEGVTMAAGVPTVWLAVIRHMQDHALRLPHLQRVIVGGAAMPDHIHRAFADLGVTTVHAWGMTEMSPIGTFGQPTAAVDALPEDAKRAVMLKQGRPMCGIDLRIVDENGAELPRDGVAMGALQVRGPTVTARYFRHPQSALTSDGYFDTGDIATLDAEGFMMVADRAKDIIKSGGEFISSIDIENAALSHAAVALAAVIAMPHPKWDERPLLLVQRRDGDSVAAGDLLDHLAARLPKHWLPDEIRFVDTLPLGATGKIDKKQLRIDFARAETRAS
ncbi:MAG: long-chain fatty acid--CoA ligase [Hyphomicrobium sp.]